MRAAARARARKGSALPSWQYGTQYGLCRRRMRRVRFAGFRAAWETPAYCLRQWRVVAARCARDEGATARRGAATLRARTECSLCLCACPRMFRSWRPRACRGRAGVGACPRGRESVARSAAAGGGRGAARDSGRSRRLGCFRAFASVCALSRPCAACRRVRPVVDVVEGV